MQPQEQIVVESKGFHRFLVGLFRVSLTGEALRIEGPSDWPSERIPVGSIDAIAVRGAWFWSQLTIRTADGMQRSVGGLDKQEATRIRDAVLREQVEARKQAETKKQAEAKKRAEAEARRRKQIEAETLRRKQAEAEALRRKRAKTEAARKKRAEALGLVLKQLDGKRCQLLAGDHYVRHSDGGEFHDALVSAVQQSRRSRITRQYLDQAAQEALKRLASLESTEGFPGGT